MIAKSFDMSCLSCLVVEDNSSTAQMIKEIIYTFGMKHIAVATDGSSALKALAEKPYDIVICDVEMAPTDGIEFLKLLRLSPDSPGPKLPVIMLSGHTYPSCIRKACEAGATNFLAKPVVPRLLYSRMVDAFDAIGYGK